MLLSEKTYTLVGAIRDLVDDSKKSLKEDVKKNLMSFDDIDEVSKMVTDAKEIEAKLDLIHSAVGVISRRFERVMHNEGTVFTGNVPEKVLETSPVIEVSVGTEPEPNKAIIPIPQVEELAPFIEESVDAVAFNMVREAKLIDFAVPSMRKLSPYKEIEKTPFEKMFLCEFPKDRTLIFRGSLSNCLQRWAREYDIFKDNTIPSPIKKGHYVLTDTGITFKAMLETPKHEAIWVNNLLEGNPKKVFLSSLALLTVLQNAGTNKPKLGLNYDGYNTMKDSVTKGFNIPKENYETNLAIQGLLGKGLIEPHTRNDENSESQYLYRWVLTEKGKDCIRDIYSGKILNKVLATCCNVVRKEGYMYASITVKKEGK